uniref:GYF domain-containing protein n=1 Tax=Populus davidiana TaxID=266767 RepID=A0A6M2E9V8_9ROSI
MGDFVWMEEYTDGPPLFAPPSTSKRKARTPRKLEFTGWGSTLLIEFLQSIGTGTTNQISQYDVTAIINKYVKDRNLLHPTKKKRVLCDEWLLPLFGRKTINRIRIYDLLEPHFAENKVGSDDDFFDTTDDDEDNNAYQRHKCLASDRKCHSKKRVYEAPKSCFAAIVPDNIKLVYLKRLLVQDLAKNNPETFQGKIVGSFVRIKSDPNDYLQKNSHMLVQVTGLVESSRANGIDTEVLLEVSNYMKDVRISMLSDDNFSKEECEDLNQRVRDGSLKRPTIVELEEKAQVLHEDITKHWLRGELAFLQKLIDRANEKGWRRELFDYLERKKLLETPDEQTRLLLDIPKVIADEIEDEPAPEDFPVNIKLGNDGSPKSSLDGVLEIPNFDVASNETSTWISFSNNSAGNQAVLATPKQSNRMDHQHFVEAQPKQLTNIIRESNDEPLPVNIEDNKHRQCSMDVQVIDLSDSEEDEGPRHRDNVQIIDCDPGSFLWHYLDPQGDVQGPFSLTLLKRWNDADYFLPGFKVWKTGQSRNEAVLLSDVLRSIIE